MMFVTKSYKAEPSRDLATTIMSATFQEKENEAIASQHGKVTATSPLLLLSDDKTWSNNSTSTNDLRIAETRTHRDKADKTFESRSENEGTRERPSLGVTHLQDSPESASAFKASSIGVDREVGECTSNELWRQVTSLRRKQEAFDSEQSSSRREDDPVILTETRKSNNAPTANTIRATSRIVVRRRRGKAGITKHKPPPPLDPTDVLSAPNAVGPSTEEGGPWLSDNNKQCGRIVDGKSGKVEVPQEQDGPGAYHVSSPLRHNTTSRETSVDLEEGILDANEEVAQQEQSGDQPNANGDILVQANLVVEPTEEPNKSPLVEAKLVDEEPSISKRNLCRLGLVGIVLLAVTVGVTLGLKLHPPPDVTATNTTSSTVPPTLPPAIQWSGEFYNSLPNPTRVDLKNVSSPQYRAFEWLNGTDGELKYRNQTNALFRKTQRFALATLYFATNGDNWTYRDFWMNGSVAECQWFGSETCTQDGNTVLSLNLYGAGLRGFLPREIALLTSLTSLHLNGNDGLSGSTIPKELYRNMTNLRNLNLDMCNLSGSVAAEFGLMSSLESLSLGENQLSGQIPSYLGLLSHLTKLGLWHNNLVASIPSELYLLTNLTSLEIGLNSLTGRVSTNVGQLTNLESLLLDYTNLTGPIPSEVYLLQRLTDLTLRYNQLTGSIPSVLGKLSNLQRLHLEGNMLTGTIPTELGTMSALTTMTLYQTNLNGTVPNEVCALVSAGLDLEIGCNRVNCSCRHVCGNTQGGAG